MAGERRGPRVLGPPRLPVLLQASGERRRGAPARRGPERPGGLRCLHCRPRLSGPGRAHPPAGSRGTAAARRARAGGGAESPRCRPAARGGGAGSAPATSRRWRRWGSHPASSAGSGRWHLQPRRKAPSSFSSLLRGSSLLPRPRRTGPRIPGQRHSRGDSVSHGGGSRPRRPAPEGKGGEGPGASSRSRRHQGNLRGGTPDPADAVPGSAARPSLSLSLPLCRGAIRNQAALV